MQLTDENIGDYIIIKVDGRLDASWSDYFADTLLDHIRSGHHQLIIDARDMAFLSSAGIRSLVRISKELHQVKGSFLIVNAQPFVAKTIGMTGFNHWLSEELPEAIRLVSERGQVQKKLSMEVYVLKTSSHLSLMKLDLWTPWEAIQTEKVAKMAFPDGVFALGIGSAAESVKEASGQFGDFLALGGHVIFQSPQVKSKPDYLLSEKEFIPELHVIQALACKGKMTHLIRFSPDEENNAVGLAQLAEHVLSLTRADMAAMVILGELDGLVGASLIRSPGTKSDSTVMGYPAIRDWLSFSGERVYSGYQSLIFGVVSRTKNTEAKSLLIPLPSNPHISGHFHAAIFPYQPLQNGEIELVHHVHKFLNGPPPQALFHLIDDDRPAIGLGQTSFIRGACWCAAITKNEEDLI